MSYPLIGGALVIRLLVGLPIFVHPAIRLSVVNFKSRSVDGRLIIKNLAIGSISAAGSACSRA